MPRTTTIDTYFRDIYRVFEEFRETHGQNEDIGRAISQCSTQLRKIENIHLNRWRIYGSDVEDDPLDLRPMLNQLTVSCSPVNQLRNSCEALDGDLGGSWLSLHKARRGWKKKHDKILEMVFIEHERCISLALSNIVYTTAFKLIESGHELHEGLALILRRAVRRRAILEKQNAQSRMASEKSGEFKIEANEWELTLSRYFDFLENWVYDSEEANPSLCSQPSSRTSSFTKASYSRGYPIRTDSSASMRSDSTQSNHFASRLTDGRDESRYFRQPRRRCSMPGNFVQDPTNSANLLLGNGFTTSSPLQPTPLVFYNGSCLEEVEVSRMQDLKRSLSRPIRKSSVSRNFHWEYVGKSSMFEALAPLTARWPELKDAQADIYNYTENMTGKEARAYASGRLATLPPYILNQVRNVLSSSNDSAASPTQTTTAAQRSSIVAWSSSQLPRSCSIPSVPNYAQPGAPLSVQDTSQWNPASPVSPPHNMRQYPILPVSTQHDLSPYPASPVAVQCSLGQYTALPGSMRHNLHQYPTLSQVHSHFQPRLRSTSSQLVLRPPNQHHHHDGPTIGGNESDGIFPSNSAPHPDPNLTSYEDLSTLQQALGGDSLMSHSRSASKSSAQNIVVREAPNPPPSLITAQATMRDRLGKDATARPLSSISERPSTSRSFGSSYDKSSGRLALQTIMYKKFNPSQQMLEIFDDESEPGSSSSGSGLTITNEDAPLDSISLSTASTIDKADPKEPIKLNKPLPPCPRIKCFSKPFSLFKSHSHRDKTPACIPRSQSQISPCNPTQGQVTRLSAELTKQRHSQATILNINDGLELPYDMWVLALPFIEGKLAQA